MFYRETIDLTLYTHSLVDLELTQYQLVDLELPRRTTIDLELTGVVATPMIAGELAGSSLSQSLIVGAPVLAKALSGVSSSVSGVSGAIVRLLELAGEAFSESITSNGDGLRLGNNFIGHSSSASVATGNVSFGLSGAAASVSTPTGDAQRTQSVTGAASSGSVAAGDVARTLLIAGAASSLSVSAGALTRTVNLAAAAASSSTAAGTAALIRNLASAVTSTSTPVGAVTRTRNLAAASTSLSTVVGTVSVGSTAKAFGSISSTTYASRSSLVITAPTGIANGNVLLAHILWAGNGITITPPAGWTQVGSTQTIADAPSGGFYLNSAIFKKVAASESGSYTWTPSAAVACQGKITRYTGCNGNVNAFSYNEEGDRAAGQPEPSHFNRVATSITTTVAGCMIIYEGFDWGDNSTARSPPTGFTKELEVMPLIYSADMVQASAGATGNATMICNANASNPRGAWLIALE